MICIACDNPTEAGWHQCAHCGAWGNGVPEEHGAPPSEGGLPSVVGDELRPHMDWSLGEVVSSRSQRRRRYEESGMIMKSAKEVYRNKDKPNNTGRAVSYPGQKNHKSSAERGGVRTKTGQRVI
tara:strand:- start:135 stop:506 length:372 start_codon:yes stop_codon:yes gene_type:complete